MEPEILSPPHDGCPAGTAVREGATLEKIGIRPHYVSITIRVNAMPIYEYRCNHCGHQFERLQKMSDPDPQRCPECATEREVTRLISAAGFRLKGGGWYETDFKKNNRRNVAGSGGEEKKKKESTGTEGASAKSEKKDKTVPAADKKQSGSGLKSGGEAPA